MTLRPGSIYICDHMGCRKTLKKDYWSVTKSGWFFQKNGLSFCPDHIPEWVDSWRKKER